MTYTADCSFWDPAISLPSLHFTTLELTAGITIRKPVLTTPVLSTILTALEQQRKDYLASHSLPDVFDTVMDLIAEWADPESPWRRIAHEILPPITGFSARMIEDWGFNIFLQSLNPRNLPLTGRLDPHQYRHFVPYCTGYLKAAGKTLAKYENDQPRLIGHICAGNIVGLPAVEMIIDKLVDAATWVKPSTEEPVFAALFAKSMESLDPDLAHTIAVLPLDSSQADLNEFLFRKSDLVRATGGEVARHSLETVAQSCKVPLAGHWHKFSFIVVSREYLGDEVSRVAGLAALDVSAWDQQGCFSPQVVFVEKGGRTSPREFAERLARELDGMRTVLPKGSKAGKISVVEGYQEALKKQLLGLPVQVFTTRGHEYLVVYDETCDSPEPSPQFRAITVRPVDDIGQIAEVMRPLHRFLQTIGVAVPLDRLLPFADTLGVCGATNVRVLGEMTLQQSWEPWDGRFPLEELIRDDGVSWVSISFQDMKAALDGSMARLQSLAKTA